MGRQNFWLLTTTSFIPFISTKAYQFKLAIHAHSDVLISIYIATKYAI